MRRDMELVRKILVRLADSDPTKTPPSMDFDDYDRIVVLYHVRMMAQAGLVELHPDQAHVVPTYLTWEGNDFLDAVEGDCVWTQTKKELGEFGSRVPFEVLKAVAVQVVTGSVLGG